VHRLCKAQSLPLAQNNAKVCEYAADNDDKDSYNMLASSTTVFVHVALILSLSTYDMRHDGLSQTGRGLN